MKPPPAFQCYASNIIADKRYRLMSPCERFVWISIYLECWPNGTVPATPETLAKYLGYTVEQINAGLTQRVLTFFQEVNGELISPELEEYRQVLVLRNLKKSAGGKEGVKRKRDKASAELGNASGTPRAAPEGCLKQSKSNQTNQNQPAGGGNGDPWLEDYEKGSKGQ